MRKLSMVFLFVIILSLLSFAQAERQHIFDNADTFTEEQESTLQNMMVEIYNKRKVDIIIVTTSDSENKSAHRFAADYYEKVRVGDMAPENVSFSFCFDIGAKGGYGEAAEGRAKKLLTEKGDEALADMLRPYFIEKDYYGAMVRYLRHVDYMMSTGYVVEYLIKLLPFIAIAAFAISLAQVFLMKSKLKIAHYKSNADMYVQRNSLNLSHTQDIYLYSTQRRVKIESSSGGGGGGSSGRSFTSSSGRSYGGRSGSL